MKKLLATVLFCTLFLYAYSQKDPVKFGNVSIEELKMSRYEKDTSASAVILADYGTSSIDYKQSDNDFKLQFERITRIKILKSSGYKYADFEVLLYHNSTAKEKISGLKVVTYNLENGKKVETKMKSDAVFEEKYDQNLDIQKFTAPNVREGSIVEVTYKITSEFLSYFRDWEFQSTIPVVWSEYRALIPEYFSYERYTQGYVGLAVNEQEDVPQTITITSKERSESTIGKTEFQTDNIRYVAKRYRWATQDVPAFKEEPYMTTDDDYISKINFELAYYKFPDQPVTQIMGTWNDLNRSMLEHLNFGDAVSGSGFLKKITEDVIAGKSTPQEKIAAIYTYVKTNIQWDGRYRKFTDETLRKALDEKKGSSADINLLLVSMLQKAGLPANPVLISTRDNGFIREQMAISSQFNYVIAQVTVDGKNILLDATDRILPIHILPERCLNGKGYIISKDTPGWVTLGAPKSKIYALAETTISSEGYLNGKIDISHDGFFGHRMRTEYLRKGEEQYMKDLTHRMSWQIEKSEFQNIQNLSESVKERHTFTHMENIGNANVLYISPILYLRQSENPFKLEQRVYPVDFGKTTEQTFVFRFTVPENFQAEEIPVSKIITLPNNGGKYVYNVSSNGNLIIITSTFSINTSLFSQQEYPYLREFYNQIVAKQSEQLVLKKKN